MRKFSSARLSAAFIASVSCLLCTFNANTAAAATIYDKDGVTLDVFGHIQAFGANSHAVTVADPDSAAGNDNTLVTKVRAGISGRSRITDGLYGIGVADMDLYTGTDHSDHGTRYAYAGIDAMQYGILTFGRGDGAFYTIAGATDIYKVLDTRSNVWYSLGDQRSGQIMYSLSALGWDLRLSYQSAVSGLNDTFTVHSGFSAAISTHLSNGVGFAYGYSQVRFNYEGEDLSLRTGTNPMLTHFLPQLRYQYPGASDESLVSLRPRKRHDFGVALTYGTRGSGLYAAAVFTSSKYSNFQHHIYDYELALSYSFDCGLTMSAGYSQQRFGRRLVTMSDLNLAVSYSPIPQLTVFAEAQLDLGASSKKFYGTEWREKYALGENKYVVGLQYSF